VTVGDALHEGALAIDEDLSIREVVALFVERGIHFMVVTDPGGRVSGLIREGELIPHIRERAASSASGVAMGWQKTWTEPARSLMSAARCVHEGTPLRHALGLMATRRDRQIVVVDAEGSPVGTLCDVEAMHILNSKTRGDAGGRVS
jgi:CBS domain-containing protein